MTRQANALLVILVGFLLAWWLRFGYIGLPEPYLIAILVTLAVASVVLPATGAFRRDFEWAVMRRVRRLLAGWAVVVVTLVSVAAMLKVTDTYSRIWFGSWVIITTVGLVLVTFIVHAGALRERRRERAARRVVLVGAGDAARLVLARLRDDPRTSMNLAACFGEPWDGEPVRPIGELQAFVESERVQEVWIAVPWERKELLDKALAALRECVVDVNVVPDLEQYRLLNQNISEWGGLPVISLAATPMTGAEQRLKAVFDRVVALAMVVVLLPLFLLVALLVKLTSKGPVLFRQQRHGMGGEAIEVYKFRTMVVHKEPEGQLSYASEDDPRVTRIGRWLRKSSIDELPQLFNVLKGEMSLVGPRPQPIEHNQLYQSHIPKYVLRHKVKPGITGWAQVNGLRGEITNHKQMTLRIEHDLWYIQNWSLWLDLKILMMTPLVLVHRNAY